MSDEARAAIKSTTDRLLAAVNASDAEGALAVWADDGVMMPPNHPSVHGRAAIGEYFRALFARSRFTFSFPSSEILVAGDIALERVTYSVVVGRGSAAAASDDVRDTGKGLHVYRRQVDGGWRLVYDIWSSDRPPS